MNIAAKTEAFLQRHEKTILSLSGVFIGFLNGFFGGGGGMLCVPALSYILKLPEKEAHATAIFVILPMSVVSAVVYFLTGSFTVKAVPVGIGVVPGGALGAFVLSKLKNKYIALVFAAVMIAAGVKTLCK